MKRITKGVSILVASAVLLQSAYAQDLHQWKNVTGLMRNDPVWVKASDTGRSGIGGGVTAVDDKSLTLDLGKKGSKSFSVGDVTEVKKYGAHTKTYQKIGSGLILGGAALELGITVRNARSISGNNPTILYSAIPLWAIAGGVILLFTKGRPHTIFKK